MRTILHLDMNSYFATAEQQANPYLRGKPIGIIKAAGRGCIIAASVEAKRFGVRTGTTVWEAQKMCPQIVLVPSDMEKYFSLTQKLIQITDDYSPVREIFSIDEVFADLTETQYLFGGGALQAAMEIKVRIRRELGEWMRCSVGISFTKLLAKLASEMHKPDGLTWLTPGNYLEQTEKLPVEEVCGIGRARTKYLHARGAYTLGQARKFELPTEIADLVWLKNDIEMVTDADLEPAKSVSRTFTTFREFESRDKIEQLVRNLVEEAAAKLREMKMAGRTFCLSLSSGQRQFSFWARRTVESPTDDPLIIFNLLWQKFTEAPLPSVRFAGVHLTNLIPNIQLPISNERQKLLGAADEVNRKWGLFTLYPARLLSEELIRPEVTGFLGDKWYRFGSAARGS